MMRPSSADKRTAKDALRRRLSQMAVEGQARRADAAVERVLALLADEYLATEAGKTQFSDSFELECGVLDQVWDDPRVFNRRGQLERQGVLVQRVAVETQVAGKTFLRTRLRVQF